MKTLSKNQVTALHSALIREFGGIDGIRDEGLLESALAAPFQTFGGEPVYPSLQAKAAQLGFGLIASVGLFIDFTMANTGKSSGTGESLSEPADAGEQVNISYCLSDHTPSLKICKRLKYNQAASPLFSNSEIKCI